MSAEKVTNKWKYPVFLTAIGLSVLTALTVVIVRKTRGDGSRLTEGFQYSTKKIEAISPKMIHYDLEREFVTGMRVVTAIAPDNTVYIGGGKIILCFLNTGKRSHRIHTQRKVTCLFADTKTVAAGGGAAVMIFSHDGRLRQTWQVKKDRVHLTAIVRHRGHTYVCDAGNRLAYRFDERGMMTHPIGRMANGRPRFVVPSPYFDLIIWKERLIIVNPGRHHIETHDLNGNFMNRWGKTAVTLDGFSGCCNPCNIAILPNGNIVTAEKGITRLKEYDRKGKLLSIVASPSAFADPTSAPDIAAGPDARVYALDTRKRAVLIFKRK